MITAKNLSDEEFFYGHKACAGCGGSLAVRNALKVLGKNSVAVLPAGCMSAVGFNFPQLCFSNNAIISTFAGTASMLTGIEAGLRAKGRNDFTAVGFAGDGGTADIGIQALSGAIDRNDNIIYICYDNEAYMNTGIQKSGLTPFGAKTTTTPNGNIRPKKNMFEIAHSVKRQETLYSGKRLYSFLDNHDVSRIASSLNNKKWLKLVYSLMFTLPGVPSIYYQSEFGIEGTKSQGDKALRPSSKFFDYGDLTNHIKNLCDLNKRFKAFIYGQYEEIKLKNEFFCFARKLNDESAVCAINISNQPEQISYNGLEAVIPPNCERIFVNNQCVSASCT